MTRALPALVGAGIAALAGCSGGSAGSSARTTAFTPISGACPVTAPGAGASLDGQGFNYRRGPIAVELWPAGHLVAGELPGGGSYARIVRGQIVAKLGWWRAAPGGQLRISGRRLDAIAPPLRADIPDGYGSYGFQATDVTFPTAGCWSVVGSVGRSRLAFTVAVRKD